MKKLMLGVVLLAGLAAMAATSNPTPTNETAACDVASAN